MAGFSNATAQLAAGGIPADLGIESSLLEVERELLGGRGRGGMSQRRPEQKGRGRGEQVSSPGKDRGESDLPDGKTVQKIAKDVLQAVDHQYGGLVSRLRSRMRDYEKRVDFARASEERWFIEKDKLEEHISDLKYEATDLRSQMASAVATAHTGGGAGGQRIMVGARKGQTAGQKMQRKQSGVGFDVDIEGMEQNTGIMGMRLDTRGMWTRFWLRIRRLQLQFMPLQRDIKLISSRYGRVCGGFFRFHRFLGFSSWLMLLLYLPLLVPHAFSEAETLFTESCGKLPLGCGWLYGGFYKAATEEDKLTMQEMWRRYGASYKKEPDQTRNVWLAFRYISTLMVSSVALLCWSIYRWSMHDLAYQSDQLAEELNPRPWSKLVVAAWDFRLKKDEDRRNFQQALSNQMRALYSDWEEATKCKKRTRCQRYLLYLQRTFGITLNFALIGAAWMAISFATVNKATIKKVVAGALGGSIGQTLSTFAPNICVALVGMILPTATKIITAFEQWPTTVQARQNLWRLYIGKILNIFIFVAISVELVVGKPLFGQKEVLAERDSSYRCVEDQAASKLMSLVASEFVLTLALRPLNTLMSTYVLHKLSRSCGSASEFQKPPFDMADYAVDIIYFQCLLWCTAVWVPSIALIAPILLFGHFNWLKFTLFSLSSRPFVAETAALSVTLLQLNCVSCVIFVAMAYALVTRELPHLAGCGPFEAGMAPGTMLSRIDVPGASTIRSVLGFCVERPAVILPVVAVLFLLTLKQRNGSRALRTSLAEVQTGAQRQVEALEGELWRTERQNELLNRRMMWHQKSSAE